MWVRTRPTARAMTAWRRSPLKAAHDDARYQGTVTVFYPFHPFCGQRSFSVLRRYGCGAEEHLELLGSDVRQVVPTWMVDADVCRQMTCGLQPAADLPSLLELIRWLENHPTADL